MDHELKIELIDNSEENEHCLARICIVRMPNIDHQRDQTICRLAARALIQELLYSKTPNNVEEQKFILDIALKFDILCSLTTFVGMNSLNPEQQIPSQIFAPYPNNKVHYK